MFSSSLLLSRGGAPPKVRSMNELMNFALYTEQKYLIHRRPRPDIWTNFFGGAIACVPTSAAEEPSRHFNTSVSLSQADILDVPVHDGRAGVLPEDDQRLEPRAGVLPAGRVRAARGAPEVVPRVQRRTQRQDQVSGITGRANQ